MDTLSGTGYVESASGFGRVTAIDTLGSNDSADLYGSTTATSTAGVVVLSSGKTSVETEYFTTVRDRNLAGTVLKTFTYSRTSPVHVANQVLPTSALAKAVPLAKATKRS